MTSVLTNDRLIFDPGSMWTRPSELRLVFPRSLTAEGVLDGGWWPRTRDPAAELPDLVAAVADRVGLIDRIALNPDAWDTRPALIRTVGHRVVRLDWFGASDAHLLRMIGCAGAHLDLLMIPPDTATALAMTCLNRAAGQATSADRRPGALTGCAAVAPRSAARSAAGSRRAGPQQIHRWETDGGRTRELT